MPIYIVQGKPIKEKINMGMSASQANLLCLTSRLHDVENAAQFIESEKIKLATEQDEIYTKYCNALDATKIQVAFNSTTNGERYFVDATFESVCTYDPTRCKQYSLTDSKTGKIFVTNEMKEAYEHCKDDKYSFAWEMLELAGNWNQNWGADKKTPISVADDGRALTDVEELVFRHHADGFGNDSNSTGVDKTLNSLYNNYKTTLEDENATEQDKLEALNKFRDYLYSSYGSEIYNLMRIDKNGNKNPLIFADSLSSANRPVDDEDSDSHWAEDDEDTTGRKIYTYADFEAWMKDAYVTEGHEYVKQDYELGDATFPKDEFDYYVNLWTSITNAGGCIELPMGAQSGDESNDWFNDMVKSGRAIINVYNENTKEWDETNVATSVNVNFLQENEVDGVDLKKAEAEYEYQLSSIEKEDTQFDRELSKLETERNSIKEIMESVKKIKDENMERTFNIFS